MKNLKELLGKIKITEQRGDDTIGISSVYLDSRRIEKGSVFVAIKGEENDGHDFISDAVKNGAIAVICEKNPDSVKEGVAYIKVADSQIALAEIARVFYGDPSSKLKLIGVTGTNGKTTTATLLYRLFQKLGYKCGLISTVRNMIGEKEFLTNNTTPDSLALNELLSDMVKAGCSYCFMEVSSHSVVQHRIDGLRFAGAIFTNLTHDHLDYHGTFEEYLKAKKGFLDMLSDRAFILSNLDDENAKVLDKDSRAIKKYFSLKPKSPADFHCKIMANSFNGLFLDVEGELVNTKLVGSFNAYNFLGIYGTAILLGEDKNRILEVLSHLEPVEGRFEDFTSRSGIVGIVDYAHTPDALEKVLNTIREIIKGDGLIITVVGCGGDRDKTKRPKMAKIANNLSDIVILTSDNPRSEDANEIIKQMKSGISKAQLDTVFVIPDREEAIKTACKMAKTRDVIFLAGKGHETYQEIKGTKYPFDDMEKLKKYLK